MSTPDASHRHSLPSQGASSAPARVPSASAQARYAAPPAGTPYSPAPGTHAALPASSEIPAPNSPAPNQPSAKVNVWGIIALAVLTVNTLQVLAVPTVIALAADIGSVAFASTVLGIANVATLMLAIVLAAIGLSSPTATRLRWTATGSLVAGCLGMLGAIASFFGSFMSSAFPLF